MSGLLFFLISSAICRGYEDLLYYCQGGKFSSTLGSSSWSKNQINIGQISMRKKTKFNYLPTGIHRHGILKIGKMRYISHPELGRKGKRSVASEGKGSNSQEYEINI